MNFEDKETTSYEVEVDIMSTAMKIRRDEFEYATQMRGYVDNLRKQVAQNPAQAKKDARSALVRTGVLSSNGRIKKKIVSWE